MSVRPSIRHTLQVAVYAKKTETGGRGGLHDHHLVLSDSMQGCNFDRLMESDDGAMFRSVVYGPACKPVSYRRRRPASVSV
jgi:hypothetical protein